MKAEPHRYVLIMAKLRSSFIQINSVNTNKQRVNLIKNEKRVRSLLMNIPWSYLDLCYA